MRNLLLFALLASGGCQSMVTVIPPHDMTVSSMGETYVRINMYVKQQYNLPKVLDAIPVREDHSNSTTDGWGRQLIYQVEGDGFSLTSLGEDGVAGGVGDDADIVRQYRLVDGAVREISH